MHIIALFLSTLQTLAATTPFDQAPSDSAVHAAPALSRPAAGAKFKDPVFGTTIMRLTDARAKTQGKAGIVPEYSKRQAFNSDESYLLLRGTDGTEQLFDGKSYAFIKTLEDVSGEDVFWHPTDPKTLYCNPGNVLRKCNVDKGACEEVFRFKGYEYANTRAEGNLSRDGTLYAVAGQTYNEKSGEVTFKSFLVLDVKQRKIIASHSPARKVEGFDWISISPSGKFVVVDYATDRTGRYEGVEVYDLSFKLVWQKPLGAGHSDLTIDADGSDVLVIDVYDADSNQTIYKKYRLRDGAETTLLATAQPFDQHLSCRNTAAAAGWCVVSTFDFVGRPKHSTGDWLAFEDEIFALKLDGSRAVRRLAHHRSRRYSPATPDSDHSVYFAEPHATVSARGDRVLFGSNFEKAVGEEASLDTYVIDLRR